MALLIFALLVFFKPALCSETSGPLTSETILGRRLTNRESDNLKHIQQINMEALDLYLRGETYKALTIYHEYLLISSLSAPIEIFQNMAWMLRSYEEFDVNGYGVKTQKLEQLVHIITSFQGLINLQGAIVPVGCEFAQKGDADSKDGTILTTWTENLSYGMGGIKVKLFINFHLKPLEGKSETKTNEGKLHAQIISIGGTQYLPYFMPSKTFSFHTIYDHVYGGILCNFPYMFSVNKHYYNTRLNPYPSSSVGNRDIAYLNLLKKSLTGFLDSHHNDNEDIARWYWDMTFSNIRDLHNHQHTPRNVLTSTHVAALNFMQLLIEDVVLHSKLDGDIIEAGVFRGGMSIFMIECLNIFEDILIRDGTDKGEGFNGRKMFLADTFKGIPDRTEMASDLEKIHDPTLYWPRNSYNASLSEVYENLQRYGSLNDRVVFLVGPFSELFQKGGQHPIKKLSILRIDSDTLHATLLILERLYPLLVPGGYVVVDDFHLAGCRLAVLNYREKHNLTSPVMPIPNDYIMSCSILSPSSNCTNELRRMALLEDIVHQRGQDSRMYRRLAPQGVYWRKD